MDIGRQKLPHDTPLGIPPEEAVFFVTLCAKSRNPQVLTQCSDAILEAVHHRHTTGVWFCRIFLIMPDHAHALLRFPNPLHPMTETLEGFKRWTARCGGFQWQRDYFDRRLRHGESLDEKADYILMNPVRAGHVKTPEDWSHVFLARETHG